MLRTVRASVIAGASVKDSGRGSRARVRVMLPYPTTLNLLVSLHGNVNKPWSNPALTSSYRSSTMHRMPRSRCPATSLIIWAWGSS